MSNESNIRHGRHCIFELHVHWVFVAKYRRRVFDAQAMDLLRGIFADVCSDAYATLVQMDGEDDHVHLLGPIHKAAEDPELTFTTASLSALSFPDLKDGACRAS
jgi:REP element-mobilizing transposase RayT